MSMNIRHCIERAEHALRTGQPNLATVYMRKAQYLLQRNRFHGPKISPENVVYGETYLVTQYDRAYLNIRNNLQVEGFGEHAHHGTLEISAKSLWPPMIKAPCECFEAPPHYWTTHYGAVDPATTLEHNPECPAHGY